MAERNRYKPPKRSPGGTGTGRKKYGMPKRKSIGGQRKNAKSGYNKLSGLLLKTNKYVRDANALSKGTIMARIERRLLGKGASQALGSSFLKFFQK